MADREQRIFRGPGPWTAFRLALPVLLLPCIGCMSLPWSTSKKTDTPPGPADSLVLGDGGLVRDKGVDSEKQAELDGAKRLYQDKEYAKAEVMFHKIAHAQGNWLATAHATFQTASKKLALPIADDALYYEAVCQVYQKNYRDAEGTLRKYMKEFRNGAHANEANRRLFDIANYWLDDTRKLMQAYEEKREGKRFWVMPASYVHWSHDKPLMDSEGHALQCLEDVRLNDIGGPLGEKALFYIATIKFFREDYKDADYYYSQLYEHYPNSPLAPKAIKQAIICKQLSTGGSCYDCRPVEESRKLIDTAARAYPQLISRDKDWISRQLVSVNLQQADRDFNIAEFYRRSGHPGSAYFYYELVIRRYPNTEYAEKAAALKNAVRDKVVHEQGTTAADPKLAPDPGQSCSAVQPRRQSQRHSGPGTAAIVAARALERIVLSLEDSMAKLLSRGCPCFLMGWLALTLASCSSDGHFTLFGYSTRPNYDPGIRTVYVPIFQNVTYARGLEFDLTRAVIREIEAKTPFKTTDCRANADTELIGKIVSTTKGVITVNQLGEVRDAQAGMGVELVWRDLRPGSTGTILSIERKKEEVRGEVPAIPAAGRETAAPPRRW